MSRFHQKTAAGIGRAVEVEQPTGKRFAYVSLINEKQMIEVRMEADALESVAQGLLIAARRIREYGQ